jgi:hypothetical protein
MNNQKIGLGADNTEPEVNKKKIPTADLLASSPSPDKTGIVALHSHEATERGDFQKSAPTASPRKTKIRRI